MMSPYIERIINSRRLRPGQFRLAIAIAQLAQANDAFDFSIRDMAEECKMPVQNVRWNMIYLDRIGIARIINCYDAEGGRDIRRTFKGLDVRITARFYPQNIK